jgi:hypothetical protein
VGYNGRGFFSKRFFSVVDTTEKNLRMANKLFSIISHNAGVFLPLYPTPQQNLNTEELWDPTQKFHIVSHNVAGFLPLYPTMEDIFLGCGIQGKRFSSIVGYSRRCFFPLWDTMEEVFFPLWDTMEKNDTTQNNIFKF